MSLITHVGLIRLRFYFCSMSLRCHFDTISMLLRYHVVRFPMIFVDSISIPLRAHPDFIVRSLPCHFHFTSVSIRIHVRLTLPSLRFTSISLWGHFESALIPLCLTSMLAPHWCLWAPMRWLVMWCVLW